MKKLICIMAFLSVFHSATALSASAKCSAKAAEIYYSKLLQGNSKEKDFTLSFLRKPTNGDLSGIEINTINGLIFSCEKGIENKSYDTKGLWQFNYDAAKKINLSESAAKAYADGHVAMYVYGKNI